MRNVGYKQWPSAFNDEATIATAILDRPIHHGETITIVNGRPLCPCTGPHPTHKALISSSRSDYLSVLQILHLNIRRNEPGAFRPLRQGLLNRGCNLLDVIRLRHERFCDLIEP